MSAVVMLLLAQRSHARPRASACSRASACDRDRSRRPASTSTADLPARLASGRCGRPPRRRRALMVVVAPLPGRAGGRGVLEDQRSSGCVALAHFGDRAAGPGASFVGALSTRAAAREGGSRNYRPPLRAQELASFAGTAVRRQLISSMARVRRSRSTPGSSPACCRYRLSTTNRACQLFNSSRMSFIREPRAIRKIEIVGVPDPRDPSSASDRAKFKACSPIAG
jgi:hypothetical protein